MRSPCLGRSGSHQCRCAPPACATAPASCVEQCRPWLRPDAPRDRGRNMGTWECRASSPHGRTCNIFRRVTLAAQSLPLASCLWTTRLQKAWRCVAQRRRDLRGAPNRKGFVTPSESKDLQSQRAELSLSIIAVCKKNSRPGGSPGSGLLYIMGNETSVGGSKILMSTLNKGHQVPHRHMGAKLSESWA